MNGIHVTENEASRRASKFDATKSDFEDIDDLLKTDNNEEEDDK